MGREFWGRVEGTFARAKSGRTTGPKPVFQKVYSDEIRQVSNHFEFACVAGLVRLVQVSERCGAIGTNQSEGLA